MWKNGAPLLRASRVPKNFPSPSINCKSALYQMIEAGICISEKIVFFLLGVPKKKKYIYIYIGLISHKYFLTNPFVILTDSSHTLEVKVSFPIVNPISCIKLSWNSKPYICRKTLQPKIFRAYLVMLLFNVAWTIVSLFKQHNMYFHNT